MKTYFNFKTGSFFTCLIAASFITASCENTQQPADAATVAADENDAKFDNKKQERDAQFLVDATAINLEEIRLGELAQQKGSLAEVKELGKMMVEAHSKSLKEVREIAKTKQVSVPDSATAKAQDAYAMLNAKSGNDFDKAYCNMMVDGHKDAIEKFERISADSRDGEIKDWATTMLPELRKHLDHVFECQKKCENM